MLARGDQVRLPNGRGVGIVISQDGRDVHVFVGRQQVVGAPKGTTVPMLDVYVDFELMYTGKHFARVGREIMEEWLDMLAAKRRPDLAIVTGS